MAWAKPFSPPYDTSTICRETDRKAYAVKLSTTAATAAHQRHERTLTPVRADVRLATQRVGEADVKWAGARCYPGLAWDIACRGWAYEEVPSADAAARIGECDRQATL